MKRENIIAESEFRKETVENVSPSTSGINRRPTYVFPFEKLDVWQMSVDLADYVLELLANIPFNKHIRLVSQMEGAVVSVSQNIAEANVSY